MNSSGGATRRRTGRSRVRRHRRRRQRPNRTPRRRSRARGARVRTGTSQFRSRTRTLDAGVRLVVEQRPVDRSFVVPLAPLRDFAAHEQQLLARGRPLESEQRAQVGELLPAVARHLGDERALAVHDFVVRQRQDVVLRPRVHAAEGELVVVIAPVHRFPRQVLERVVHPAHVPLEAEPEPADVRRSRHHRPRRRLLRVGVRVGKRAVHLFVQLPEESDRLEVLASAELVGDPLARLTRVVEVQHRRDGVDPQAVDVVAVEPEASRCSSGTTAPRCGRS